MHLQPCSRPLKQHAWPIGSCPAQRIKPAGKTEGCPLLGDFYITVSTADLRCMKPALFAGPVSQPAFPNVHAQLFSQRVKYHRWHSHRIVKKSAEVADRAELHGEAEPVVVAALLCDHRMIGIVQMKVAGEVVKRRNSAAAATVLALFVPEEADTQRAFLFLRFQLDGNPVL